MSLKKGDLVWHSSLYGAKPKILCVVDEITFRGINLIEVHTGIGIVNTWHLFVDPANDLSALERALYGACDEVHT